MSQTTLVCKPEIYDLIVRTTNFTAGWICDILYKHDPSFKQKFGSGKEIIGKVEAFDLQKDNGFAAKVFKTTLFLENSETPFHSCIVKVPNKEGYEKLMAKMYENKKPDGKNDEIDSFLNHLLLIHDNECRFYEHFGKVSGFTVPEAFYMEKIDQAKGQTGLIVMEDLSKGAKVQGFLPSLRVDQVKKLVECIARFHAYQLVQPNPKWVGTFSKGQTNHTIHLETCKGINNVKAYNNGIYAKQIDELEKVFFNYESKCYLVEGICDELGIPKLVNLGDFHSNNVLFKIEEDDLISNQIVSIIDFQAAFEGSPALDLARLIVVSLDAEIRREVETFIFDFYMENLTKHMKTFNKTPPFDVKTLKKVYEFAFLYQCHAVIMVPPYFKALVQAETDPEKKHIIEAQVAKLELRGLLALEDALTIVDKYKSHWSIKV
uniref:CHK kinase-like domain-containing protein n=1 Tax=Acrobeloides nanus TaxID=290746 RepID=A0A914DRB6_9BILA